MNRESKQQPAPRVKKLTPAQDRTLRGFRGPGVVRPVHLVEYFPPRRALLAAGYIVEVGTNRFDLTPAGEDYLRKHGTPIRTKK